jgi:hypothetical protein
LKISSRSIISRTIPVLAIIAITIIAGLPGGCVSINPGSLTTTEHREDRTLYDAAQNIILNVSTINGYVEIRESAGASNIEVTYDVFASEGHLLHVLTGANSTRIDNNTVMIEAGAKLNRPDEGGIANHGANIIVTIPKGSHCDLNLTTLNGNVIVPALNGGAATLNTLNGNVELNGGNYTDIDASTLNGDVTVKLQEGTLFYVDASTLNGQVRHGLIHMAPQKETERELVGYTEAGNGSLRMKLSTLNGNVEISY